MRIIQKQISLEPMTSRLPGLLPAYKDGELYLFDETNLKARGYEYPTNWGMIPLNLVLTKNPSEIKCTDTEAIVSCDETEIKFILSWERLSQWYNFFKEYYHILKDYGHCKVIYGSAVDYYNNESRTKYASQMRYGSDLETYKEMDRIFSEMGGKAEKKEENGCIVDVTDNGFYCWLNKYIISGGTGDITNITKALVPYTVNDGCITYNSVCPYAIPTMDDNINLQLSIDDLGEYAIFSEEYELGKNTYNEVVYLDEKSMVKISGKTGYDFNQITMEMELDVNDWEDYTSGYISGHSADFDTNFKYYAYDSYGVKQTGESVDEVKGKLKKWYPITEEHGILINGSIYEIYEDEYLDFNNKRYYVKREKDTQVPYTHIAGNKIYASYNFTSSGYVFSFSNSKVFPRTKDSTAVTKEYILYNGTAAVISADNKVTINNVEYIEVDGYFYTEDDTIYYSGDSNTYRYYALGLQDVSGYTKEGDYFTSGEDNPIILESGKITGRTVSKLEMLVSKNPLVDDAGYTLYGTYDVGEHNNYQPKEGEVLGLLYESGNTANITPYIYTSGTTNPDDLIGKTVNYFVGDIITSMLFYYLDIEGDKTKYSGYTIEEAYNKLPKDEETKKITVLLESDDVYCDITYMIGATLERSDGEDFKLAEGDRANSGVVYTETVQFIKKNEEYHLKAEEKKSTPMQKKKPAVHSVSYPVVCYELSGTGIANFEMDIFQYKNGAMVNNNVAGDNKPSVFPVLRKEYMLGSAVMQNVNADIYIDRGINYATDKHLKLGEVHTLEALENYNNGYFKFMEN